MTDFKKESIQCIIRAKLQKPHGTSLPSRYLEALKEISNKKKKHSYIHFRQMRWKYKYGYIYPEKNENYSRRR